MCLTDREIGELLSYPFEVFIVSRKVHEKLLEKGLHPEGMEIVDMEEGDPILYYKRSSRTIALHGTLLEIFGIGVFLSGKSGIGKSETTLELIRRGHLFVSDDLVWFRKATGSKLLGFNKLRKFILHIRGVGMIDIFRNYGISSIKPETHVELNIHLVRSKHAPQSDTSEILGVKLERRYHRISIEHAFVNATVIEEIVKDYKLRKLGVHAEEEFYEYQRRLLDDKADRSHS